MYSSAYFFRSGRKSQASQLIFVIICHKCSSNTKKNIGISTMKSKQHVYLPIVYTNVIVNILHLSYLKSYSNDVNAFFSIINIIGIKMTALFVYSTKYVTSRNKSLFFLFEWSKYWSYFLAFWRKIREKFSSLCRLQFKNNVGHYHNHQK